MPAEAAIVHENVSLKALNTLGVEARARCLVRVTSVEQLQALLETPGLPGRRLVLGGGSNVLFRGDFDGLVLHTALAGLRISHGGEDAVHVTVGAGENWHRVVRWTLARGQGGLENLSLIPGSAGAAPIQNIGAYGVELRDRFHSLTAVRLSDGAVRRMPAEECGFAYRGSRFREQQDYLIADLTLRLPRPWRPVLEYPGLREELAAAAGDADPLAVSDAVCALRRRKLPDPAALGNAGSFFKNPTVDVATWQTLSREEPRLVRFPADRDKVKLAAASLIECCGWKGYREGDAGVSERHALILVNHGHASGEQLWQLALRIRDSVQQRFGILLQPEPVIVGDSQEACP